MTTDLNFTDHVSACEYMGEENPTLEAWGEGPVVGAARVAYVDAHKAHAAALATGDTDKIDSAWNAYCAAQNAYVDAIYA